MLRNSKERYGLVTVALHWITAPLVLGLFGLGVYMVGLTYHDPWYRTAPHIHKGIGVLLFLLVLFRVAWGRFDSAPLPVPGTPRWQARTAAAVHGLLYALLIAVPVSGYFISTAEGQPLDIFDWFSIPALITSVENLEDTAGAVHRALAYMLAGAVAFHALAALKHHFIDKDATLRRMLGLAPVINPD